MPRIRGYPTQGAGVTVLSHGDPEPGFIAAVSDDRTDLIVVTESGERAEFRLRRATGRFESRDGRRLKFEGGN